MKIKSPKLSYKQIGKIADEFLLKYHPSLNLPIPIEEIAEKELNLEIIPQMKIKQEFDIDGCLTSDLSAIFIDYDLYMKYENRTRFTIAHEIGHLVLHGDLFKSLNINSPEDVYLVSEKTSDEEYRWLEYQAYAFAGHVLVPTEKLFEQIKSMLGKTFTRETPPETIYPIVQDLLEIFQVSGDVLLRRLQKEGLVKISK